MNLFDMQCFTQRMIQCTEMRSEDLSKVDDIFRALPGVSAIKSIEIYRDMYQTRVFDTLLDDFPRILKLMGDERFDHLAQSYIKAFPSKSYTLEDMGQDFALFLEQSKQERLVIDLAKLEWAVALSFRYPLVVMPGCFNDLQVALAEGDDVALELNPRCHVLDLDPSLLDFCEWLEQHETFPEIKQAVTPLAVPHLVYQSSRQVFELKLTQAESWFLESFRKAAPMGPIVDGLLERFPSDESQGIINTFGAWIESGVLLPILIK